MGKTAVVLFNLGAPDSPAALRPFLFNLFNDRAILDLPNPMRWVLAKRISSRRAKAASAIYDQLGGGSPLLENTRVQAEALGNELAGRQMGDETRIFIAMRYWRPLAPDTVAEVAAFGPDRVVLLPLYPQFSTTTTESSFDDWRREAKRIGLDADTRSICCYPTEPGMVEALAAIIENCVATAGLDKYRLLFTAHGLPQRVIERGDPYGWQTQATMDAVLDRLGQRSDRSGISWRLCYQSRVGRLEWIGPSTLEAIDEAGREGMAVVVVPHSFVSEHSETLVELDIEYRKHAEAVGVPKYVRAPALATHPSFIGGLADLVEAALDEEKSLRSCAGGRICPGQYGRCARQS